MTPIICRIDARAMAAALGHPENLSWVPFVWTGDMPLLVLPVDARPADIAGPDANSARRAAFLGAARPNLDRVYRLAGSSWATPTRPRTPSRTHWSSRGDRSRRCVRPTSSTRGSTGSWSTAVAIVSAGGTSSGSSRWTPPIDPAGRDPFQAFIERDALLAGLARLTPDERIVVVLRFWADLPLDAIAQRLDWPLGTVKSRLHRALERLRGALAHDEAEATR